jgi:hypothetical protein
MDDGTRPDRDPRAPDPTNDAWSAWLPHLDDPRPSAPQPPDSPPPPPVTPPPVTPLPQAGPPLPHVSPTLPYAGTPAAPACPAPAPPVPYVAPPPTHLVAAIICTFICFMPFGIVALVKASSVNRAWARGRWDQAYRASRSARNWCILAALVSPGLFLFVYALGLLAWMVTS